MSHLINHGESCKYLKDNICEIITDYTGTQTVVHEIFCVKKCVKNNKEQALLKIKNMFTVNEDAVKQTEYKKGLPKSKLDLIKHAGKDAKAVLLYAMKNSGKILADGFVQGERQATCKSCEFNVKDKCTKCGCHLAGVINKTQYAALSCPIHKW